MTTLPSKYCLYCGAEITRNQHCVEMPEQFARRYNESYCRAKCKRQHTPARSERTKPALELISHNVGRVETVAQEKEVTPRDAAYLDWIRAHDCVGCGWPAHMGCIESHHVRTGGMAIKGSDYESVPLCSPEARGCHAKADKTPVSVERYLPIALMFQTLYIKAGHKIKRGK